MSTVTELVCEVRSEVEVSCNGTLYSSEDDEMIEPMSLEFWLYLAIYVALVLFAGHFSPFIISKQVI